MGTDSFGYDPPSRLTSASIASYQGGALEAYGYDAYGNLTSYEGNARTTDTTNRLNSAATGAQYDAAGNMLHWGLSSQTSYTFTYTPLNQIATVTSSDSTINRRLAYTADGERIVVRDTSGTMLTLRGLDGRVLSEMTFDGTNWSWSKDYVYGGNGLLSSVSATAGLRNYTVDHLGSPRLVTSRCGDQIDVFAANAFGLDVASTQDGSERMRFTVHERDLGNLSTTADDIDNMHARSYMPVLGRFTSADLLRGDPRSPQSFNLFEYVKANPVSFFDPLGLQQKLKPIPCKDDVPPGSTCYSDGTVVPAVAPPIPLSQIPDLDPLNAPTGLPPILGPGSQTPVPTVKRQMY